MSCESEISWESPLGKAYLHLFNEISRAMDLLHQQDPFAADVVLMEAQRKGEELLICGD